MGNQTSSSSSAHPTSRKSSSSSARKSNSSKHKSDAPAALLTDLQQGWAQSMRHLEQQDHPAAALLDSMCGPYLDPKGGRGVKSSYSEDYPSEEDEEDEDDEEEDSRTLSEEETTVTTDYRSSRRRRKGGRKSSSKATKEDETTIDSRSYQRSYDDDAYTEGDDTYERMTAATSMDETEQTVDVSAPQPPLLHQPLASSFAKRCYFTKAGIGGHSQHYEGLTLSGNVILMLAAAMKLKGCPTICDEDLRRVEQTFPNQFSRLPDELLLSSGWRRISKYCHFSNKPIPDGIPFFHSKQRLHPSGGYYFLLAGAVGMVRPIDVEPLNRDTLVLLETDYPTQCDAAPAVLVQDPDAWTLVDKFCFFSGGPINTDEDVYYRADFDGNPIYMLAFLSPSLTPSELYKLDDPDAPLASIAAVEEVESVYDLTERDFDDLKLYHLGPCRALPPYILQPAAWTKVLPPHFLAARETALIRAHNYEQERGGGGYGYDRYAAAQHYSGPPSHPLPHYGVPQYYDHGTTAAMYSPNMMMMPDEGDETLPLDEARYQQQGGLDPPEDEPPSLRKHGGGGPPSYASQDSASYGGGYAPPPDEYRRYPIEDDEEPQPSYNSLVEDEYPPPHSPTDEYCGMERSPPQDEDFGSYHNNVGYAEDPYDPTVDPRRPPPDPYDAAYDDPRRHYSPQRAPHYPMEPEDPFDAAGDYDAEDIHRSYESRPYAPPQEQPEYQNMEYYNTREEEEMAGRRLPGVGHPPPMEHKDQGTSPTSGSEYSAPTMNDDGFSSGFLYMSTSTDVEPNDDPPLEAARRVNAMLQQHPFPPTSPRSEYSQSSAMRGAQELLRRNRQKRLELAAAAGIHPDGPAEDVISPQSQDSSTTWQTGSEGGGSSIWTNDAPDRSSRRALILQMARARMKNQHPVEEKKLEHIREAANEVDLTSTLDLD